MPCFGSPFGGRAGPTWPKADAGGRAELDVMSRAGNDAGKAGDHRADAATGRPDTNVAGASGWNLLRVGFGTRPA